MHALQGMHDAFTRVPCRRPTSACRRARTRQSQIAIATTRRDASILKKSVRRPTHRFTPQTSTAPCLSRNSDRSEPPSSRPPAKRGRIRPFQCLPTVSARRRAASVVLCRLGGIIAVATYAASLTQPVNPMRRSLVPKLARSSNLSAEYPRPGSARRNGLCGLSWNRTSDRQVNNLVLCPLSYQINRCFPKPCTERAEPKS